MVTKNKQGGFCIVLLCAIMTICAEGSPAQGMLQRIMTVDDPELGKCLRAAIQHIPVPTEFRRYSSSQPEYLKAKLEYDTKRIEVARAVTESYAQIKLLDSQIELLDKRLDQAPGKSTPDALQYELILARAELESKRLQEFAKLREAIGIIPRHAFGQIQLGQLNTWLTLHVLNREHVLVFEREKPFTDDTRSPRFSFVKDMTYDTAIAYVLDTFNEAAKQPLRADIMGRQDSISLSEQLHLKLEEMAQQRSLEMDTDIRLVKGVQHGSERYYFHINGEIASGYNSGTIRGKRQYRLSNTLDAESLREDITYTLRSKPGVLPLRFVLEHDEASLESAKQTAATIEELVRACHLAEFVSIVQEPTELNWQPLKEQQP